MGAKLVYRDDCRFCTWAAALVARRTDIEPVGMSWLRDEERERLPDDYEDCAHLLTDDRVYSCGEAMEEAFVRAGVFPGEAVRFARQFEEYHDVREAVYGLVADNRSHLSTFFSEEAPIEER